MPSGNIGKEWPQRPTSTVRRELFRALSSGWSPVNDGLPPARCMEGREDGRKFILRAADSVGAHLGAKGATR